MKSIKYNFHILLKSLLLGFLFAGGLGCSTGSLFVDSSPQGSKVYLKPLGGNFQEIGATPLTKSLSDIVQVNGAADAVLLEVRKDGFVPEQIVITDVVTRSDLKITVALEDLKALIQEEQKRQLASEGKEELPTVGLVEVNEVIDEIFEVQRLVKVGRTQDAIRKLEEIQKVNSQLAVVYEMQGGIAYLKKDYFTAFDAYTLAVKYNPKNIESINMRNFLKEILEKQAGGRLPAKE